MGRIIKRIILIAGLVGGGYGIFVSIVENSDWFILWIIMSFFCFLFLLKDIAIKQDNKRIAKVKEKIESIPTSTASATVVSKLHEKTVDGMAGVVNTKHSYYIVFGFPDYRREKFVVDKKQYALVCEGDKGILSYKKLEGELLFVDFQPQS